MAVNPQNIPVSKGYLGGLARRIVAGWLVGRALARGRRSFRLRDFARFRGRTKGQKQDEW